MIAVICGGGMAALSGALLAQYITLWTPTPWSLDEIFPAVGAMIIGGRGNNWGAAVGTLVVDVGIGQGVSFLPAVSSDPGLSFAVQWILEGLVLVAFLWFRPAGIIPERKARFAVPAMAGAPSISLDAVPVAPVSDFRGTSSRPALPAEDAQEPARDTILSCEDVSMSFGGIRAVDAAALSVRRGSITGLIGPNGAGKSTLVNVLSGHLRSQAGQVMFDGAATTGFPSYRMAQRGLVRTFQLSSEFPRLTVLENMMVAPDHPGASLWNGVFARRRWKSQEYDMVVRARGLLDEFGLLALADEYAGNLSGGQKRLLELARALMRDPTMLLLDEPMAGVAPSMVDRLVDQILDINQRRGVTFLIVEHDLDVIDRLCPTVLVMIQGRVMAEGNMQQLREDERVIEAYLS
jgi:ABC-type branched-subunit amino acid transport system ATPase component